ncbi:RHS repeat-associated core domain-containing protein [Pseudomonas protegens]|uniref:RHS repeat-associated core domain-containing protein n=1 Tax=Pseudomonas protegens TaxID=380021 RepID=UPI00276E4D23|nr:RHS repeat-associated core domain-containing protein [Pseudomonas protegens]MDP9536691.1 RHS repeat-associated core domain-containing protein [Pseudomonas protegens]
MTDRLTISDSADDAAAEQRLMDERRLSELQQLKAELDAQKAAATQAVAAESAPVDRDAAATAKGGSKRHVAHDSSEWQAVCSVPDFCWVGPVVVAFDSFATLDRPVLASSDVKARGTKVYRLGDLFNQVQADAGAHVVAGTSLGAGNVKLLEGHSNVKVNGLPLARHNSACLINCNAAGVGGTLGKIVTTAQSATAVASETSDLAPPGERTSERLQALEAEREALKQQQLDIDGLDKYIDFDGWNKSADEGIASIKQGAVLGSTPMGPLIAHYFPAVADADAQVTRGVTGFAKDTVMGIGELAYTGAKHQAKSLQSNYTADGLRGRALDAQILAENMRLGNITPGTVGTSISNSAKAVGSALVKPVTDAWSKGNHIEAVTRAGVEILTLPWTLFKAGKAAEAAKAANALKNANRTETVAHAGDGVHVRPQGAAHGSAEDVKTGRTSDSGKNCETSKCSLEGEPVDVATGDYLQTWPVLEIPGSLPLKLSRLYRSRASFHGLLGFKWADDWSQHLVLDRQRITYHTVDGSTLDYEAPDDEVQAHNRRNGRYLLSGQRSGTLRLYDRTTQQTLSFAQSPNHTRPLTAIEDSNGNRIRFIYGPQQRLQRVEHSDGYQLHIELSSTGHLTGITLHDGEQHPCRLLSCRYAQHDMLTDCASHQFGTLYHAYNNAGHMTQWHDTDKTHFHIAYDAKGRVIRTHADSGHYTDRFEYHEANRCTDYHDAEGGSSRHYYNSDFLVVRKIDALGHEWLTEWDEYTNKVATTDPLGRTTTYRYSDFGELLTQINPDGTRHTFDYNTQGLLTRYVAADGVTWQMAYDAQGNLSSVKDPDGRTTTYQHGAHGELLSQTWPEGTQTLYRYDRKQRLSEIQQPDGQISRVQLDTLGRPLQQQDALGQITRYAYHSQHAHPRGSLSGVTLADGTEQHWAYDSEHRLASFIDGEGHRTRYAYGAFDLLEKLTYPGGQSLTLGYDRLTRLTRLTNGVGDVYQYAYDKAGRLIAERDFAGTLTRYCYNAVGWLSEKHCADGARVAYHYDIASARLLNIAHYRANGELSEQTEFNYNDVGHLIGVNSPGARIEYQRDAVGRLLSERINGRLIEHQYDPASGLPIGQQAGAIAEQANAQEAFAALPQVQWQHDRNGGLAQLLIAGHAPLQISRDALGRDIQRSSAAGFNLHQHYNSLSLLTEQKAGAATTSFVERHYRYDKAFNPIQIDDNRWGQSHYRYNANQQLIAAHLGQGQPQQWLYDNALNLLSEGQIHSAKGMGIHAEQQGGRVVKSGANRYRYDACGRLAEKIVDRHGFRPQRWQYRWNSDNRLTDLYTPNNEHWRYEYDAFGRRTRKFNFSRSNKRNSIYAHSEQHIIGEEYLWSGEQLLEAAPIYADGTVAFEHATRWSYAPGGITPLAQQQGEKLWYIVTDHLGTPRELLDESGQLGWSNSPNVWGQARLWQAANDEFASSNVVPINKTTCPIRFPGQYYDEESGLHYNRHRYYDPETAQYLSPDPLGLGGGTRPQGYVDNPNSWIDPLALASYDFKWGNPKSKPTYGHTFSEHGQKLKPNQLTDRARSKGHQVGQYLDDNVAADFIADVAKKGPGVHEVPLPANVEGRGYLPNGIAVTSDMARVIVKPDGSVRTSFPYNSSHSN